MAPWPPSLGRAAAGLPEVQAVTFCQHLTDDPQDLQ